MRVARWQIFLLLSLLVHILFLLLDLSYYEEGGDTFIKNTLSGVFTGGEPALPPFSFGGHFVLNYLYLLLYKISNTIPWYDIFIMLYSIIAAVLVFESFNYVLKKNKLWLSIVLGLLFCLDNVLMLEITRISLTIAITSSFLLLSLPQEHSKKRRYILQVLLCLSMFIRIESFFLGSFLMLSILLISPSFLRNIKLLAPAIFVSILLAIALNVNWTPRDKQYNDIREYQFVILDYETKVDKAYINPNDSVTLALAKLFFLNDPQRINKDFLSIYLAPLDKNPLLFKDYLANTDFSIDALQKKLNRIDYRYLLWWFSSLLFVAYLILRKKTPKKVLLLFVLYSLVLVGIFFIMKMENRLLLPTSIGLVLLLLFVESKRFFPYLLIISSVLFLSLHNPKYHELTERFGNFVKVEEKLRKSSDIKLAVLDLHGSVWYGRRPFYKHEIKQNLICLDNAILFVTPEYQRFMIKSFGTNETGRILKALSEGQNVTFIGDLDRATAVNNYFNQVYGFDFKIHIFEKIDEQTSLYQLN